MQKAGLLFPHYYFLSHAIFYLYIHYVAFDVDKKPEPDDIVRVKIAFDELELWQNIKDAGGKWSKSLKTWKLPYKMVRKLGLKTRIADE
jgi:hypothetical protein